jgi:hypothetical protein
MMTPTSSGKAPEWLRVRWERTKRETAARVQAAVDQLRQQGRDVTFESIREVVRSLHGVPISANTIKRNELACQIYSAHRHKPKVAHLPEPALRELVANAAAKNVAVCSPRSHASGVSPKMLWSLSWFSWSAPSRSREMLRIGCAKKFFA